MSTFNQICKTQIRIRRRYKNRRKDLQGAPQKQGTTIKAFIVTPRKPNSALRKVARVGLSKVKKAGKVMRVTAYIPGIGHNLHKHSKVLVRGGRVKDIPGMKYTLIRKKYDLECIYGRKHKRSKYGVALTR